MCISEATKIIHIGVAAPIIVGTLITSYGIFSLLKPKGMQFRKALLFFIIGLIYTPFFIFIINKLSLNLNKMPYIILFLWIGFPFLFFIQGWKGWRLWLYFIIAFALVSLGVFLFNHFAIERIFNTSSINDLILSEKLPNESLDMYKGGCGGDGKILYTF